MSEENSTRKKSWKDNYLVQAWLILLMAALYSAVLILVQLNWGPIIKENQRQATYSQIPVLVPNTDVANVVEKTLEKTAKRLWRTSVLTLKRTRPAGFCPPADRALQTSSICWSDWIRLPQN